MNRRTVYLVLFLILLAMPAAALAQEATPVIPDDAVNAIAKQMYCPVCENIPLDVCGTQACHQWRELIRQRLAEGWSEQQIKDYFVQQYGDRVLAEPPRQGFNWLVYIVPPVVILLGVIVVFSALRKWRMDGEAEKVAAGASSDPMNPPEGVDARYIERLEEELRKRG